MPENNLVNNLGNRDILKIELPTGPDEQMEIWSDYGSTHINHSFWINDLEFKLQPRSITINEDSNFLGVQPIRANGAQKIPIGIASEKFTISFDIPNKGSITNIDERDSFVSSKSVGDNTGMRGGLLDLIIQFKHVPFAVIENAVLRAKLKVPPLHNMVFCLLNLSSVISEGIIECQLEISPITYVAYSDMWHFKKYWVSKNGQSLETVNTIDLLGRLPYLTKDNIKELFLDIDLNKTIADGKYNLGISEFLRKGKPESTYSGKPQANLIDPKYQTVESINNLDLQYMAPLHETVQFPKASEPFKVYIDWLHSVYQNKTINGLGETFDFTQLSPYGSRAMVLGRNAVFVWKEFKNIQIDTVVAERIRKLIRTQIADFQTQIFKKGLGGGNGGGGGGGGLPTLPKSKAVTPEGKITFFGVDGIQPDSTSPFAQLRPNASGEFTIEELEQATGQTIVLGNDEKIWFQGETIGSKQQRYRFHKGIDITPNGGSSEAIPIYTPFKIRITRNQTMSRSDFDKHAVKSGKQTRRGVVHDALVTTTINGVNFEIYKFNKVGSNIKREPNGSGGIGASGQQIIAKILEGPFAGKDLIMFHMAWAVDKSNPNTTGPLHNIAPKDAILEPGDLVGFMGSTSVMESSPHLHLEVGDFNVGPDKAECIGERLDMSPLLLNSPTRPPIPILDAYYQMIGKGPGNGDWTYWTRNDITGGVPIPDQPRDNKELGESGAVITAVKETIRKGPNNEKLSDETIESNKDLYPFENYRLQVRRLEDMGYRLYTEDLTNFDLFYKEHTLTSGENTDIIITSMSFTLVNNFKLIPIQGVMAPTAQFLGRDDSVYLMSFKCNGLNGIKRLEVVRDTLKKQGIMYKHIPEAYSLRIENNYMNAAGDLYFLIQGISVAPAKEEPGFYTCEMRFVANDIRPKMKKIKRESSIVNMETKRVFIEELTGTLGAQADTMDRVPVTPNASETPPPLQSGTDTDTGAAVTIGRSEREKDENGIPYLKRRADGRVYVHVVNRPDTLYSQQYLKLNLFLEEIAATLNLVNKLIMPQGYWWAERDYDEKYVTGKFSNRAVIGDFYKANLIGSTKKVYEPYGYNQIRRYQPDSVDSTLDQEGNIENPNFKEYIRQSHPAFLGVAPWQWDRRLEDKPVRYDLSDGPIRLFAFSGNGGNTGPYYDARNKWAQTIDNNVQGVRDPGTMVGYIAAHRKINAFADNTVAYYTFYAWVKVQGILGQTSQEEMDVYKQSDERPDSNMVFREDHVFTRKPLNTYGNFKVTPGNEADLFKCDRYDPVIRKSFKYDDAFSLATSNEIDLNYYRYSEPMNDRGGFNWNIETTDGNAAPGPIINSWFEKADSGGFPKYTGVFAARTNQTLSAVIPSDDIYLRNLKGTLLPNDEWRMVDTVGLGDERSVFVKDEPDLRSKMINKEFDRLIGGARPGNEFMEYVWNYLIIPYMNNVLTATNIYKIATNTDWFPKTRELIIAGEQNLVGPAYEDLDLPLHPYWNEIRKGEVSNLSRESSFTEPDFYLSNPAIDYENGEEVSPDHGVVLRMADGEVFRPATPNSPGQGQAPQGRYYGKYWTIERCMNTWGQPRPPGLPVEAPSVVQNGNGGDWIKKFTIPDSEFFKILMLQLSAHETGQTLSLPAGAKGVDPFDIRPDTEPEPTGRPPGKNYVSAWGLFGCNDLAWQGLANDKSQFGYTGQAGLAASVWLANEEQQASAPIALYRAIFNKAKEKGFSDVEAGVITLMSHAGESRAGILLAYASPDDNFEQIYVDRIPAGESQDDAIAWLKNEVYPMVYDTKQGIRPPISPSGQGSKPKPGTVPTAETPANAKRIPAISQGQFRNLLVELSSNYSYGDIAGLSASSIRGRRIFPKVDPPKTPWWDFQTATGIEPLFTGLTNDVDGNNNITAMAADDMEKIQLMEEMRSVQNDTFQRYNFAKPEAAKTGYERPQTYMVGDRDGEKANSQSVNSWNDIMLSFGDNIDLMSPLASNVSHVNWELLSNPLLNYTYQQYNSLETDAFLNRIRSGFMMQPPKLAASFEPKVTTTDKRGKNYALLYNKGKLTYKEVANIAGTVYEGEDPGVKTWQEQQELVTDFFGMNGPGLGDSSPAMQTPAMRYPIWAKVKEAIMGINRKKLAARRAYPTVKIYFYDEDDLYSRYYIDLDEVYTYSCIESLDISESRKRPAAVARITFLDPNGILSGFNQFTKAANGSPDDNKNSKNENQAPAYGVDSEAINKFLDNTKYEQNDIGFVLRSGLKIKIKLGYSNDANKLEEVFLGEIADVTVDSTSDRIEVVALSYGAELASTAKGNFSLAKTNDITVEYLDTFDLLSNLMFSEEIVHFGRRKIDDIVMFTEDQSLEKHAIQYKETFNIGATAHAGRHGGALGLFAGWGSSSTLDAIQRFFTYPFEKAAKQRSMSPSPFRGETRFYTDSRNAWQATFGGGDVLECAGPQDDNIFAPNFNAGQVVWWTDNVSRFFRTVFQGELSTVSDHDFIKIAGVSGGERSSSVLGPWSKYSNDLWFWGNTALDFLIGIEFAVAAAGGFFGPPGWLATALAGAAAGLTLWAKHALEDIYVGDKARGAVGTNDTYWISSFTALELMYTPFYSTVWDVFEEMTYRHPGYVKHPRIYTNSNRMTMFFGMPDQNMWESAGDPADLFRMNRLFLSMAVEAAENLNKQIDNINETTGSNLPKVPAIQEEQITQATRAGKGPGQAVEESVFDAIQEMDGVKQEVEIEEEGPNGTTIKRKIPVSLQIVSSSDKVTAFLKAVKRRFRPFRRWHTINSYTDIISNEIEATADGWYTEVNIQYNLLSLTRSLSDVENTSVGEGDIRNPNAFLKWEKENIVTRRAHIDLSPNYIRSTTYQFVNCKSKGMGKRYAKAILAKQAKDMYKGSVLLMGSPHIRPYDVIFINDTYSNMYGPIEVEEVHHTFSEKTGFLTKVFPDTLVVLDDCVPYVIANGIKNEVYMKTEMYAENAARTRPMYGNLETMVNMNYFSGQIKKIYDAKNQETERMNKEITDVLNAWEDPDRRVGEKGRQGYDPELGPIGSDLSSTVRSLSVMAGLGSVPAMATALPMLRGAIPVFGELAFGTFGGIGAAGAMMLVPVAIGLGVYYYASSKITELIVNYIADNRAYFMIPMVKEGVPMVAGTNITHDGGMYKGPAEYIRQYWMDAGQGLSLKQADLLMEHSSVRERYGNEIAFWLDAEVKYVDFMDYWDRQWLDFGSGLTTSVTGIQTHPLAALGNRKTGGNRNNSPIEALEREKL
jgi:hypothetical protein